MKSLLSDFRIQAQEEIDRKKGFQSQTRKKKSVARERDASSCFDTESIGMSSKIQLCEGDNDLIPEIADFLQVNPPVIKNRNNNAIKSTVVEAE